MNILWVEHSASSGLKVFEGVISAWRTRTVADHRKSLRTFWKHNCIFITQQMVAEYLKVTEKPYPNVWKILVRFWRSKDRWRTNWLKGNKWTEEPVQNAVLPVQNEDFFHIESLHMMQNGCNSPILNIRLYGALIYNELLKPAGKIDSARHH